MGDSNKWSCRAEDLKGTQTEKNLQEAFAGESQARNKYTFFASKAKKEGYVQISNIFAETAANEKEHAEIWYKILTGIGSTIDCLKEAAEANEKSTITTAVVRDVIWLYISGELNNMIGGSYAEAQGRITLK